MPPTSPLPPTAPARRAAEARLVEALLTLRTPDELRGFLLDLCTPGEIEAMAGRWAVVECLARGLHYREIHRLTGVSLTTISRVARCLSAGHGGYALARERLQRARRGGRRR